MSYILCAVASFMLALLISRWVWRHSHVAPLDVPNSRSSHTVPTPRGGGIALLAVWLLACTKLLTVTLSAPVTSLAIGGSIVGLAGWLDDRNRIGIRARLAMQFAAGGVVLGGLFPTPPGSTGFGAWEIAAGLVLVLGIVWCTNLYNFMDGLDGIASLQAIVAGGGMAVMFIMEGAHDLAFLALAVAAGSAGFLVLNWPPARLFMGDVGSGLLGFVFASLAIAGVATTSIPLAVLLLPLTVFITDATLTLAGRVFIGQVPYRAHRMHLYQRLARAGWSHKRVTVTFGLISVGITLIAVAGWALRVPHWWSYVAAGAVATLAGASLSSLAMPFRVSVPPPETDGVLGGENAIPGGGNRIEMRGSALSPGPEL